MVFFTCNHCGESLKKQAVDKHYFTKCRGVTKNVSCMDCQKDFHDEEYVAHIKCISEAEKYSGKDYIPKESANSNAKKQESWMDIVRSILETKDYNLDPKTKAAFERLQSMDNVPRKKAKFINYANNCLKMYKPIAEKVWAVLEKELEKMKKAKAEETAQRKAAEEVVKKEKQQKVSSEKLKTEDLSADEPPKKKKKKNKDYVEANGIVEEPKSNSIEAKSNGEVAEEEKNHSKKKKKKSNEPTSEVEGNHVTAHTSENVAPEESEEFQFSSVIERLVLKHPDGITLTKLQKKLLKKYLAKMSLEVLDEKQQKKFDKKFSKYLKKSPALQLEGDLVKPC